MHLLRELGVIEVFLNIVILYTKKHFNKNYKTEDNQFLTKYFTRMTINVNFRVVGMYLGANFATDPDAVVVKVPENPTVFQIMKAVAQKATYGEIDKIDRFSFNPSNPSVGEDLSCIFINFTQKPKDNRPYGAGLYILSDNLISNPITTFQYYIHDNEFRQLNVNNKSKKFSEQPDVPILDGYTVIVRQVAILINPIEINPLAENRSLGASRSLTD